MTLLRIFGVGLALLLMISYSSIFVVDERQKALVLQFGQIKAVKENPGLAFKICLLYTSPSPRDQRGSRMPSSA